MNTTLRNAIRLALLCGALGGTGAAHAEDIDIYTTGQTDNDAPNVLLFIDNTSNWSAQSQRWNKDDVLAKCGTDSDCIHYVGQVFGDDSNLTQGAVELRTLEVVLTELVCPSADDEDYDDEKYNINFGLMLFSNANGTADGNSVTPGYIRRAIKTPADVCAGSNSLLADLRSIETNDTNFNTSSSADYGTALYEAFKYFGGYANTNGVEATTGGTPAGRTGFGPLRYGNTPNATDDYADPDAFTSGARTEYLSPIGQNICGQNYIVLIGNTWPNQEYGTNQNASPPNNTLMSRLSLQPQQLYAVSNKSDIRFADEWSQFLARTDVHQIDGQQTVKTYTIDVFNTTTGSDRAKQAALLDSMAINGGTGIAGAFTVNGNLKDLVDAFKRIFTQIASINSAFASAALPISANTQGTYLNQVFVGMFRPTDGALPRWSGNLKQYQFALQTTTDPDSGLSTRQLFMADANGNPAVDNVVTGFIDDCAASFWTHDSGNYWESVPGSSGTRCPTTTFNVYSDSPDGPIVERGGVAQQIRDVGTASSRKIRTCAAATSNCTGTTELSIAADASALDKWIRGDNVGDYVRDGDDDDEDDDLITYGKSMTAVRPNIHGGVVHSRPLALNYGSGESDVVVFYGADDGMLRAIDGSQTNATKGDELWAFLAPEFKSKLERLRNNTPLIRYASNASSPDATPKDYFFDGSIGAYVGPDPEDASLTVTYIYPSMRRGGRMIYAFNATNKPSASTPPSAMWRFGCDDDSNCFGGSDTSKLGQTWSTPRIIRVKVPNESGFTVNVHAVFGGGYDACEDAEPRTCTASSRGNGIFVLDAKSGTQQRYISLGDSAGRVIADVVAVDTNRDNFTDVLYAVDTSGNLWRLNIGGLAPANWVLTQVAKVSDWSSTNARNRKFLYAPTVVTLGNYNLVLAGTGDREKPLNTSAAATVKNRFYGFWDRYSITSASDDYVLINDSTDCDVPGDLFARTQLVTNPDDDPLPGSACQVINSSDTTLNYETVFAAAGTRPKGWTIDLDDYSANGPNEQVVTQPAVIGGQVFFSTFQATKPTSSVCSARGTARGYSACFLHGGATCSAPTGLQSRSIEFVGGGMPPSPVVGVVSISDDDNGTTSVPFCIGCADPEGPPKSAQEGGEVKIPIAKNRTKVYRYKVID